MTNEKFTNEDLADLLIELIKNPIDEVLESYREDVINHVKYLSKIPEMLEDIQLEYLIKIHLYVYDGSETGKVLISDSEYDKIFSEYISRGYEPITTVLLNTDSKRWNLVEHPIRSFVGSINKIYNKEELYEWLNMTNSIFSQELDNVKIAIKPKFDGVSSAIYVKDREITLALTRKDGYVGQDITRLIQAIPNTWMQLIPDKDLDYTTIKTEILMSNENFELLSKDYPGLYANRRSAVSGIINTPSNLHLAKYLSIMPLVHINKAEEMVIDSLNTAVADMIPLDDYYTIYDAIIQSISKLKDSSYPFRVDGVVLYPAKYSSKNDIGYEYPILYEYAEDDLLFHCIAYKTNSAFGITRALEVYPSVGRTGQVTPMLKVEPVDVNETIVTDVSLSTMKKFNSFNLRRFDKVEIESAGDVIPMVKRVIIDYDNSNDEKELTMQNYCPYCGKEFTMYGELLYCTNQECPKVRAGMITNFISKLGINGIKDATIETLQSHGYFLTIWDIFDFIEDKSMQRSIASLDGFSTKSVENMQKELSKLITEEVTLSKIFGSLGIKDISINTAKLIVQNMSWYDFTNHTPDELYDLVLSRKGIGEVTAKTFVKYVLENFDLIDYLVYNMKIVPEMVELGKVVFTGFDDEELKQRFEEKGYAVKEGITKDTTYVVASSTTTGKYKKAIEKGIPVYMLKDVEELLTQL